jgi:hypothetical protein
MKAKKETPTFNTADDIIEYVAHRPGLLETTLELRTNYSKVPTLSSRYAIVAYLPEDPWRDILYHDTRSPRRKFKSWLKLYAERVGDYDLFDQINARIDEIKSEAARRDAEYKARPVIERYLEILDRDIIQVRTVLERFAENFGQDPVYTLRWARDAYEAAGELAVLHEVHHALTLEENPVTLAQVRDEGMQRLLRDAGRDPGNVFDTLVQNASLRKWSEMLRPYSTFMEHVKEEEES